MASDVVLSRIASAFVGSLSPEERQQFYRALDVLLADAQPDGMTKVELGFPYRPRVYGFAFGDFWMAYEFLNPEVIAIAHAYWRPGAPKYGQ